MHSVRTIPDILRQEFAGDRGVTVIDGTLQETGQLRYHDLGEAADRAAAELLARGVARGDRVGLLGSTSAELITALFGVWRAGAVPVVLALPRRRSDVPDYVEELQWRLTHVDAACLLVDDAVIDLVAEQGLDVDPVGVAALADPDRAPGDLPEVADEDAVAVLQFTSGSTGRSRAVELTHANVLANIGALGEAAAIDGDSDSVVSWLPLFHDMGLVLLLASAYYGLPLAIEPPEQFLARPGSWLDAVSRYGATTTVAPNFAYGLASRDLTRRPRDLDLSSLRIAGNGAEPIDMSVLDRFTEVAGKYGFRREAICPMYGLAEATVGVSITRPGDAAHELWVDRDALEKDARVEPAEAESDGARRIPACGIPLPGVEVRIVSDGEDRTDEREVGELWVRGPSVMSGYWRDQEATDEVLEGGWLRTGDLAFMDRGALFVCGRIKDMIIVGGRNLYPEDYEQCAVALEGVRRGNVIAFGLPDRERMVVVAETKAPDGEAEEIAGRVMRALAERLSHAPEEVLLVPPQTLPKTSSGKLQRGVCRERYSSGELPALASASR